MQINCVLTLNGNYPNVSDEIVKSSVANFKCMTLYMYFLLIVNHLKENVGKQYSFLPDFNAKYSERPFCNGLTLSIGTQY